jgi:phosphonate ABC transporter permease subunit PhnE
MSKSRRKKETRTPLFRAIRTALVVIVLVFVYAYATDVTQINLDEPFEPQRQATTVRVLRLLARPDFFEYQQEERSKNVGLRVPCVGEATDFEFSTGADRPVVLSPGCVENTQDIVVVTGEGFRPRTSGIIRWFPPGITTSRALSSFRTDANGNFVANFTMPDIRPTEELQRIEIVERWTSGGFLGTGIVGLSDTSKIAAAKIAETIFLALIATTLGTLLAIPVSFLAARNLMENVDSPLAAVMLGIVGLPVGWLVGRTVMGWLVDFGGSMASNVWVALLLAVVFAGISYAILAFGPSLSEDAETTTDKWVARARIFASGLIAILALVMLANAGVVFGEAWDDRLGDISFTVPLIELVFDLGLIGRFIALIAEMVVVLSPALVGIIMGLLGLSFASGYGQELVLKLSGTTARAFTAITTGVGIFTLIYGVGSFLHWLYQFDNPTNWTLIPGLVLGVVAALASLLRDPKQTVRIGFITYTLIRSFFNIVRSIEPLVYVIVFAVWVGIGPFAGVLALTGHTVAALGKLFSEQVENISEGPIEAITATGANRLQMIVFAVIPQIIPPYIAFTFYRWDINVRVSTILGFGGGGGIGFVLIQAINLLEYRKASVYMIAIAVVVMTLDYISSKIRSRII